MQALIVLSGAAVRLTEAGLGCEDWPTCNEGELLPELQIHGLIEFGNRVISLFVTVSAIAVVVAARRLIPARPDLMRFAWALVIGTAAQIVLGGITVLLDLHPLVVGVHFLFSMGLLWAAQSLWLRATGPTDPDWFDYSGANPGSRARTVGPVDQRTMILTRLQLGLTSVVLLAGTIVTGTGPHSGDSTAERFRFDLTEVTRVHSTIVWLLLLVLVVFAIHMARDADQTERHIAGGFQSLRWMLLAVLAQGALGYIQFGLGVPSALVEAHVFGALVVWSLSILTYRRIMGFPVAAQAATMSV
jgi:cytochrome c oxidase assembly protein subunit 15